MELYKIVIKFKNGNVMVHHTLASYPWYAERKVFLYNGYDMSKVDDIETTKLVGFVL